MIDTVPEQRDPHPRLNRADAWLLAALTERSHDGRPVTLRELVHDADWLNRAIPTFDEVSFGLPRLIAAGLMTVGHDVKSGMVFRAPSEATMLRQHVKAESLGGVLAGVAEAVGAAPYPESGRRRIVRSAALRGSSRRTSRWRSATTANGSNAGRSRSWLSLTPSRGGRTATDPDGRSRTRRVAFGLPSVQ